MNYDLSALNPAHRDNFSAIARWMPQDYLQRLYNAYVALNNIDEAEWNSEETAAIVKAAFDS